MGLASAYGYSILANRIKFYRSRFFYQLAILSAAAAIVQLAADLAASGLDPNRGNAFGWQLVTWAPGIVSALGSFGFLIVRELPIQSKVKRDLIRWQQGILK